MPESQQSKINQLESLQSKEQQDEYALQSQLALVRDARQEVENSLAKLTSVADALRDQARRTRSDGAVSWVTFANGHLRFAGASQQGLKRTCQGMDRLLDRVKAEKEDQERRDQDERKWEKARNTQKQIDRMILPTDDAFDELYGNVV